jgi:hypothetical protein
MILVMNTDGTVKERILSEFEKINQGKKFDVEITVIVNKAKFTTTRLNTETEIMEFAKECIKAERLGFNSLTEEFLV